MKDSGIEWLGGIPAHWEQKAVKRMTRILRGKFSHRPHNDPRMYDGPYPFIQTGDVAGAQKYITGFNQTLNEDGPSVSKMFPRGDLPGDWVCPICGVGKGEFEKRTLKDFYFLGLDRSPSLPSILPPR